MEILLELLLELIIQVFGEVLLEMGFHAVSAPFKGRASPWLAALGYAVLGAAIGGISLAIWPAHMVSSAALRWVNVLVTPVAAGLCMAALGAWRARRGQAILRIDKFSYGYLFALSFALVRFVGAH